VELWRRERQICGSWTISVSLPGAVWRRLFLLPLLFRDRFFSFSFSSADDPTSDDGMIGGLTRGPAAGKKGLPDLGDVALIQFLVRLQTAIGLAESRVWVFLSCPKGSFRS